MTNELNPDNDAKLNRLINAERKAWNTMMEGSEIDARTVRGEEGVNYIAWCKAADAERIRRNELAYGEA